MNKEAIIEEARHLYLDERRSLPQVSKAVGVSLKPNGYLAITRGKNKGRSIHAAVMEEKLRRPLGKDEVVHHMDENKLNNSPENLMVMTRAEHSRHHALDRMSRGEISWLAV